MYERTLAPVVAAGQAAPAEERWGRSVMLGAHGAFALAAALLAILHLDRRWGPIDPVTAMLSDYALCPGWWMWDGSLILTSIGSAAVMTVLYRRGVLVGKLAVTVMGVWCLSLLGVALFSKDPQGGAVTPIGKLHLYATAVSCVSLPILGWLLGRRHRAHPHWRGYARLARWLSLAALPFYLPFIIPFALNTVLGSHVPTMATGLVERLMAVLELVLLVALGVWAQRAAPQGDTATVPLPRTTPRCGAVPVAAEE